MDLKEKNEFIATQEKVLYAAVTKNFIVKKLPKSYAPQTSIYAKNAKVLTTAASPRDRPTQEQLDDCLQIDSVEKMAATLKPGDFFVVEWKEEVVTAERSTNSECSGGSVGSEDGEDRLGRKRGERKTQDEEEMAEEKVANIRHHTSAPLVFWDGPFMALELYIRLIFYENDDGRKLPPAQKPGVDDIFKGFASETSSVIRKNPPTTPATSGVTAGGVSSSSSPSTTVGKGCSIHRGGLIGLIVNQPWLFWSMVINFLASGSSLAGLPYAQLEAEILPPLSSSSINTEDEFVSKGKSANLLMKAVMTDPSRKARSVEDGDLYKMYNHESLAVFCLTRMNLQHRDPEEILRRGFALSPEKQYAEGLFGSEKDSMHVPADQISYKLGFDDAPNWALEEIEFWDGLFLSYITSSASMAELRIAKLKHANHQNLLDERRNQQQRALGPEDTCCPFYLNRGAAEYQQTISKSTTVLDWSFKILVAKSRRPRHIQRAFSSFRVIQPMCMNGFLACSNRDRIQMGKPVDFCSRCQNARYCSAACQKADWKQHKKVCRPQGTPLDPTKSLDVWVIKIPARLETKVYSLTLNAIDAQRFLREALENCQPFRDEEPMPLLYPVLESESLNVESLMGTDGKKSDASTLFKKNLGAVLVAKNLEGTAAKDLPPINLRASALVTPPGDPTQNPYVKHVPLEGTNTRVVRGDAILYRRMDPNSDPTNQPGPPVATDLSRKQFLEEWGLIKVLDRREFIKNDPVTKRPVESGEKESLLRVSIRGDAMEARVAYESSLSQP